MDFALEGITPSQWSLSMHTNLTHHPSDHALLTTLIGGQQASFKAQCLLSNIGDVRQLSRLSIPELMVQGELTRHMAHRIHSGFQLGQRSLQPNQPKQSMGH